MPNATWKEFERRVAKAFGTRRSVLSGHRRQKGAAAGQDTEHPVLFIECKQRVKHAVWALFAATRTLAREEGKIPTLALSELNRPGYLVVCHIDDLAAVAAELIDTDEHKKKRSDESAGGAAPSSPTSPSDRAHD